MARTPSPNRWETCVLSNSEEGTKPPWCCALCPFGLTYQRFGMVWDTRNDVGMMNYIFLYINVCSAYFVVLSLGCLGVSHFGPILGVTHRLVGAQQSHSTSSQSPK